MTSFSRAVVALSVVSLQAFAARTSLAQVSVGENLRVSTPHPDWAHYEVWGSVDPKNPARLIACSLVYGPDRSGSSAYVSHDGGLTWRTSLDLVSEKGGPGDPVCDFGPDGAAYFVVLGR